MEGCQRLKHQNQSNKLTQRRSHPDCMCNATDYLQACSVATRRLWQSLSFQILRILPPPCPPAKTTNDKADRTKDDCGSEQLLYCSVGTRTNFSSVEHRRPFPWQLSAWTAFAGGVASVLATAGADVAGPMTARGGAGGSALERRAVGVSALARSAVAFESVESEMDVAACRRPQMSTQTSPTQMEGGLRLRCEEERSSDYGKARRGRIDRQTSDRIP